MKQLLLNVPTRALVAIALALGTLLILKVLADFYGFDLATALISS